MDNHLITNPSSSADTTIVLLILTLLSLFYVIFKNVIQRYSKNKKKLYCPVVGTKLNQLLNFNRLHDYAIDLSRKFKTFRFPSPFGDEIFTADPANVEYILKTNFQNYVKGRYNYRILNDLMGDGIFAVDGDKWRDQRKTASHEFSTKCVKEFSNTVFHRNGAKLAHLVSANATSSVSIDVQDLFMKSTLDSIAEVAFGVKLDSMYGSTEAGILFAKAFDDSNEITMWRYVDVSWKIKRFLNFGAEARLKKNMKAIDAFVYKLIRSKTEQISSTSQDNSSMRKQDILSRFVDSNTTTDPKYLRDIVLNFVIAGRDTTAVTLSWFLYMLCKHPHIQEKIAEEVREATKMEDNIMIMTFEEVAARMTDEALEKMQYLHAAITETLRLYPAVPMDAKICLSDDTLPDGYAVKKGDMVTYMAYAMGQMEFLWGDDANDFRPERWLNDNGIFQSENPFKFTAFQAGPRICLGKEFAYRQMKIFSAILLRSFKFKLSDETKFVKYRTTITLQVDGGLHVQAVHRFPHKISKDTFLKINFQRYLRLKNSKILET